MAMADSLFQMETIIKDHTHRATPLERASTYGKMVSLLRENSKKDSATVRVIYIVKTIFNSRVYFKMNRLLEKGTTSFKMGMNLWDSF